MNIDKISNVSYMYNGKLISKKLSYYKDINGIPIFIEDKSNKIEVIEISDSTVLVTTNYEQLRIFNNTEHFAIILHNLLMLKYNNMILADFFIVSEFGIDILINMLYNNCCGDADARIKIIQSIASKDIKIKTPSQCDIIKSVRFIGVDKECLYEEIS